MFNLPAAQVAPAPLPKTFPPLWKTFSTPDPCPLSPGLPGVRKHRLLTAWRLSMRASPVFTPTPPWAKSMTLTFWPLPWAGAAWKSPSRLRIRGSTDCPLCLIHKPIIRKPSHPQAYVQAGMGWFRFARKYVSLRFPAGYSAFCRS